MIRGVVFIGIGAVLLAYADTLQYTKTVQTTYGPLMGEEIVSNGLHFKAFRGIPYAKPPVGDLRFRAPELPEKWSRVRDASKYGQICLQPNMIARLKLNFEFLIRSFLANARNMIEGFTRMLQGSEDCLSLNVYTKQIGDNSLKPVLVYFHGGAFVIGDGTDAIYGPEFLMERDIVLVTMNYRLGALGFLSTNTSDAPGNWGLKDQVAALKWVQDNIANFGGDPKQVTIYGQSAGAASVHLHMLSPLSRGLFQKAIAASGSAACPWAVLDQQERISRRYAQILGASANDAGDPAKRVKFLRSVKAKPLADKIADLLTEEAKGSGIPTFIPFAPVVEPPGTEGAFLTEHPDKLIAEGRFSKVPLMMGFTDLEGGVLFLGFSKFSKPSDLRKANLDACDMLPLELKTPVMEKNACPQVSQQIMDLYFGGKPLNSSPLNFIYMFGDIFLAHGIHVAEKWHARYAKKDSPTYFYYYTYDGEWHMIKDMIGLKMPGAIHGDDMDYIFHPKLLKLPPLPPASPGHYNQERMLSFTTNFVKHGNPTPSLRDAIPVPWEPAIGNELNIMHIGRNLKMEKAILNDRLSFWDSMYTKYIGTEIYR